MGEILLALKGTSIPDLLVLAGVVFIFVAVVGNLNAQIAIPRERQLVAASMGVLFLLGGVALYVVPAATPTNVIASNPSTTLQPPSTAIPTEVSTIVPTETIPSTSIFTPTLTVTRTPLQSPPPNQQTNVTCPEVSEGQIQINEDFEDGIAPDFGNDNKWTIVSEENGNKVYDVNDTKWAFTNFGFPQWSDYIIEYRFKILSNAGYSPATGLSYRVNTENAQDTRYLQSIALGDVSTVQVYFVEPGQDWRGISDDYYPFREGVWYSVQTEAKGNNFRICVDNTVLTEFTDTRLNMGHLLLEAAPNTHVQFDDIKVAILNE